MKARAIAVTGVSLVALLVVALMATRNPDAAKGDMPAAITNRDVPAVISPRTSGEFIPRVAVPVLREKIERGEVLVIDVRDVDSYIASHIPGALHIPLSYIESELPYLRGSKPIVTYCT